MNTQLLLLAQYEKAIIPLENICEEVFGCARHTAITKAKSGNLPIPAFQLNDSQKSTWMIHINDLAKLIDEKRLEASKDLVT